MIEGMVEPPRRPPCDEWRQPRRMGAPHSRLHRAASGRQGQGGARRRPQGARRRRQRGREPRRARPRSRPRRRQLTRKSRRLALIAAALAVIGCAVGLGLYAMKDSLVAVPDARPKSPRRTCSPARGSGSAGWSRRAPSRAPTTGSTFNVTDGTKSVGVDCVGACFANVPDLFREGQGVVVEGVLGAQRPARRRPDPRQARRALHAARGRRSLKKQGRWQEGANAK